MSDARRLYRIEGVPVLQNRVFNTAAEARECVRGNVTLVQDSMTGLVFNEEFEPGILHYDQNYNNEQSPKPGVPAAPRWGRVDRGTPFGKNQSYGGWLRKGLFSGYAAVEGFRHRRM